MALALAVKTEVANRKSFLSFIFKGNQDLGSFNDAYRNKKNSKMFMPRAYNRCPKAGHESRFLLLISQRHVRPYPRISDTSYFFFFFSCSTLLPPASPKAHFSVIKPDSRFPHSPQSKQESCRSRMSMISIDHVSTGVLWSRRIRMN